MLEVQISILLQHRRCIGIIRASTEEYSYSNTLNSVIMPALMTHDEDATILCIIDCLTNNSADQVEHTVGGWMDGWMDGW